MKFALYPGSFDPVTSGHLNVIRRATNIFDRLVVCVMVNAVKHPMFTLEERVDMIRRVTEDLPNVEVEYSDGLLAEYARSKGEVDALLRPWYQKKSLSLRWEGPLDERIFSPALAEDIIEGFRTLVPFYHYFNKIVALTPQAGRKGREET